MELITNPNTSLHRFSVEVLMLFLLLITFLAAKSSKTPKTKVRRLPPGPPAFPIIGNLAGKLVNRPNFKWIHRVMDEMQAEIACFRFANVHVIAITSSHIAREALRDKDAVFADRPESYSSEFISGNYENVTFSRYGGHQWKKMRGVVISKLMSPRQMNMSLDARNVEADNLLAYVHSLYERSETTVNVRDIARTYCHGVMMRLLFGRNNFKEGTEDGGLGEMEREHVNAIFKAQDCLFSFRLSDYVPYTRGWNLEGDEKRVREAVNTIATYNDLIIHERTELWREKEGKEDVENWIDILITLKDTEGKPLLTQAEIRALCIDICMATIDNPTNNVEWTLAEMMNQPEIMKKAIDELNNVVGERIVQESDITHLNFIKSCIRESFRLHPVAPFMLPRVAKEDTTLAGFFIPKGSHILVSRMGLGRNPNIWEEPDAFRPERHLDGSGTVNLLEPEMRLVTFSTGHRGCIGSKLGTSMTIMLLARLVQGFKWSLPPGTERAELSESETNSLLMAQPLVACVEPRFAPHWYPKFKN